MREPRKRPPPPKPGYYALSREADLATIKLRLAQGYRARTMRASLQLAKMDIAYLIAAVEHLVQACDGFTEAIGKGVLTVPRSPTGRRRLRELAPAAARNT